MKGSFHTWWRRLVPAAPPVAAGPGTAALLLPHAEILGVGRLQRRNLLLQHLRIRRQLRNLPHRVLHKLIVLRLIPLVRLPRRLFDRLDGAAKLLPHRLTILAVGRLVVLQLVEHQLVKELAFRLPQGEQLGELLHLVGVGRAGRRRVHRHRHRLEGRLQLQAVLAHAVVQHIVHQIDEMELRREVRLFACHPKVEILAQEGVGGGARSVLEYPGLAAADGVLGAAVDDGLEDGLEDGEGDAVGAAELLQALLLGLRQRLADEDLLVLLQDRPLRRQILKIINSS